VILADQSLEIVVIAKTLYCARVVRSAYWLNIDPTGMVEAGYGREAFLEQVMVSVACNGAHSLKQRLARWLLMMRDRNDGDVLPITQNLLAEMVVLLSGEAGIGKSRLTAALLERLANEPHTRLRCALSDHQPDGARRRTGARGYAASEARQARYDAGANLDFNPGCKKRTERG
jgi:hypothetical protein